MSSSSEERSSSASPASSPTQASSGSSLSSPSFSSSSRISSADNPPTPPPASSASPSSTADVSSSTPASPTTSPTPTTPAQSSPAQTSSAAAQTTASPTAGGSGSGSSLGSSTTTPTPTTSSFTSQVATTIASTDPGGSVVYVTSTVPEVFTTSISSGTGGGSSNNTGVIVGAVVGGIAGIIILVLLLFCIRRRVRKDEFDGNFDPDRVVGHADVGGGTLPNVDLADDVTPFPPSAAYTDQGNASMRQYSKSPYIPVPSSHGTSGHASTEFYPHETSGASNMDVQPRFMPPGAGPPPGAYLPQVNVYGMGPVDWHNPRPGVSPPPSTVSNNTTSTRAAKEREAMGRSGQSAGLGLATQPEAPEGSGDVVVHQDAGRAPIEEHAPPREIPPAYESIRQD